MKLSPIVSYQGNKSKISSQIIQIILSYPKTNYYYDICCGSGAITLQLINNGIQPSQIIMIDIGIWGEFWKAISNNTFDIAILEEYIQNIPQNIYHVKEYIQELVNDNPSDSTIYKFILIQACNFGGKHIRLENNTWKNVSVKSVWEPKEDSIRKQISGTFSINPYKILQRVEKILKCCQGITGQHMCALETDFHDDSTIYVDPDYKGKYGYGCYSIPLAQLINKITTQYCLVSEATSLLHLPHCITSHQLKTTNRCTQVNAKANSNRHLEYLSVFKKL